MKSVFLLSLFLLGITAQIPTPILLNKTFSSISGEWYVIWAYNYYEFGSLVTECVEWTTLTNKFGALFEQQVVTNNDGHISDGTIDNPAYEASQNDFQFQGSLWGFIAFDPVSGSWATLANLLDQEAFIMSKNPNVTNLVLNAQIALLKTEGYAVNSTNSITIPSKDCNFTVQL